IGGGPAGLTAGIYAGRQKTKTLLIEKVAPGGQIALSENIENYPGFPEGLNGLELTQKMEEQAKNFGLEIVSSEVKKLQIKSEVLKIVQTENDEYKTLAIIIATGAIAKKLGIPGEDKLIGRGVSYCATCDGPFFKKCDVAVIGGGDTAVQEAIFLTKYAEKVYLIHRREQLRAVGILQERAKSNPKINVLWNTVPIEIIGEQRVEGIKVKNLKTNEEKKIPLKGVFILIGINPQTKFLQGIVEIDKDGYIFTDENMQTFEAETGKLLSGVYACGDCRKKLLRQVITACGEGATAAFAAARYIENVKR
ncbi:MAG TPA: thioredoxin-disulfide reductase, partial [Elusimicrobia bacterium]|nr:thioredoxin-disulfide reductase [Elusimicrobiota bacterium]